MTTPTCRTCKFWATDPFWNNIDHTREHVSGGRDCSKLRDVIDIELDQGSGYDAGGASIGEINTPHDFGCVKHEEWKS